MADKKYKTHDSLFGGKYVIKEPDYSASKEDFKKESDKIGEKISKVSKALSVDEKRSNFSKGDFKFFKHTIKDK